MNTKFTRTLGSILLIVVLALTALPSVSAQDGPPPVGLRYDAPPYALHGPYWVGTREMVIDPDAERPIILQVWYPALNPDGVEEATTYSIQYKYDAFMPILPGAVDLGHAIRDAAADTTSAPYPLVVFSHGYSGWASYHAYLPEHLATYGFVVVAPNHLEAQDAAVSFADIWYTSIYRTQDIHRTLDYAETLTAQGGEMAGMIDMEQVAVAGHSSGGYTTLAAGGARFDLPAFAQRCEAATAASDPSAWICTLIAGHEADMAALAGFDPMTEGLWPSMGDDRVDAIIPMAGDSYWFDQAGLAAITIPVMAMGGTADTGTPFEWGTKPTYDYASSTQKVLVALKEAEHGVFGNKCSDAPWLVEMGFPSWCMDPVWDMDRAHDLINHFVTAFVLATLKGDADAAAALAPDQIVFPGVTYEAQGF